MTAKAATETVYHSFDEPGLGIKDQLHSIAKTYPHIARLKTIGYSIQGRPCWPCGCPKAGSITVANPGFFLLPHITPGSGSPPRWRFA